MAKFDIDFELSAEGLSLNGYEVCYEADPIKELVAEANDLGNSIMELCREAKRVLGVDREPLSLWEQRAFNPRRDEGYYYSNALRYRRFLRGILRKAATMQGVVENGHGLYRTVREWAVAWYWWATASLEDVGLMTDYERAVDLYFLTGEHPCLESYIKDVAKRLLHCKHWLQEIKESDDIDDGYLECSVSEDVDMLSSELQFYRELRLIELETLGRC